MGIGSLSDQTNIVEYRGALGSTLSTRVFVAQPHEMMKACYDARAARCLAESFEAWSEPLVRASIFLTAAGLDHNVSLVTRSQARIEHALRERGWGTFIELCATRDATRIDVALVDVKAIWLQLRNLFELWRRWCLHHHEMGGTHADE